MGGAVVAALTAWRDGKVLSIIRRKQRPLTNVLDEENEKCQSAKEILRKAHRCFLHEYHSRFQVHHLDRDGEFHEITIQYE